MDWKDINSEKEKAIGWLLLLSESLLNELRIQGKFKQADEIRLRLQAVGVNPGQLSVQKLKEFKEGYSKHRNMPNATLWELEMF